MSERIPRTLSLDAVDDARLSRLAELLPGDERGNRSAVVRRALLLLERELSSRVPSAEATGHQGPPQESSIVPPGNGAPPSTPPRSSAAGPAPTPPSPPRAEFQRASQWKPEEKPRILCETSKCKGPCARLLPARSLSLAGFCVRCLSPASEYRCSACRELKQGVPDHVGRCKTCHDADVTPTWRPIAGLKDSAPPPSDERVSA